MEVLLQRVGLLTGQRGAAHLDAARDVRAALAG